MGSQVGWAHWITVGTAFPKQTTLVVPALLEATEPTVLQHLLVCSSQQASLPLLHRACLAALGVMAAEGAEAEVEVAWS